MILVDLIAAADERALAAAGLACLDRCVPVLSGDGADDDVLRPLWSSVADGDAWPDLLTMHYELLDEPLTRHGGLQVGTRGDGVFVAFESAADALAGALEAQATVSSFPWPEPPLRVRMGLHTGEAVVRNGDYVGLAVNMAMGKPLYLPVRDPREGPLGRDHT